MKNTNEHRLPIKKILVFCLVLFHFFFFTSCELFDYDTCTVEIKSPNNGTNFEEGDWIDFSAAIKSYTNAKESVPLISMVQWVTD
jgi:hypothetical protein